MDYQSARMKNKLLEVKHLSTHFHTEDGIVKGCDKVNYSVNKGETLAVVGESGSGKSVTAMSILGLIPNPPGEITGGEILFRGENLLELNSNEMQRIRGNSIAMIFQEPMTSLNPVMSVGQQIGESLVLHQGYSRSEAKQKAIELLAMVGIADGRARVDEYPHQLSGGMRQRVMIAIALACKPELLIADEPTSALDVTIQAQILDLIRSLQQDAGMSVMFITHDIGLSYYVSDNVHIMERGKFVESGTADQVILHPKDWCTQRLINDVPKIHEEWDLSTV